jgi:hypothetical protein
MAQCRFFPFFNKHKYKQDNTKKTEGKIVVYFGLIA